MEKIKQYPSIVRMENTIIEEKLDGSNFAFIRKDDGLHFYSRNYELTLETAEKFFKKFIIFVTEIDKQKSLPINLMFFGEALGQGRIKYFKNQANIATKDKLYIFDIREEQEKVFLIRKSVEKLCNEYGLNIVPLTTNDTNISKIGINIIREGVIYRFENKGVIKIKNPEIDLRKYKNRNE